MCILRRHRPLFACCTRRGCTLGPPVRRRKNCVLRLAAAFPVPRQMSLVQFGFTTTTRLLHQLTTNLLSLSLSPFLNSLSGTDKGAQCRARQRPQRATLDDATKRQHWIDFYPRPEGQPDQFVSSALGCCVCRFSVFLPVCLSLHVFIFSAPVSTPTRALYRNNRPSTAQWGVRADTNCAVLVCLHIPHLCVDTPAHLGRSTGPSRR